MRLALIAAATLLVGTAASDSSAQVVVVAGYAPAPAFAFAAPTVVHRPVTAVTAYSPVVYPPAVGYVPAVAPVGGPVVVSSPAVAPVVTTRFRPILGGTVSRVRYRAAPVVFGPIW